MANRVAMTAATESDDSSCSDSEDFVPYSERPEWRDVVPLQQEEGPNPVAAINYTEKFRTTFDYFRAVLKSDERSDRSFNLTTDCALMNPANYTVWYFRRILIQHLQKDIPQELDFIERVILKHPKNYQVWHHRQVLVELNGSPTDEKRFTECILEMDAKNYHAWQHRQWFINHFKQFEDELDFTESLIKDDVRNNSAWNHRHFVISRTTGFTPSVIDREVLFTLSKIKIAPSNESPWNYLRGVLQEQGLNNPTVTEFCNQMRASDCKSAHLLGFMIDAIDERLEADPELLQVAVSLCDELATKQDVIREKYWNHVRKQLISKHSQ